MKFNWGTGIFIFLTIFLLGAAAFIVFAFSQGVNLVHKDYYEKGVDYTEQMNVTSRSAEYRHSIHINLEDEYLVVEFEESLVTKIDSGNVLLYRPSSSEEDIRFDISLYKNCLNIPKQELISGRYILKIYWFSEGLKYQVDKPVNIQ